MKVTTMQVAKPQTLKKFYRDYASPEPAKYHVDLESEAAALQAKVDALSEADRRRFQQAFVETWNGLPPVAQHAVVGGVIGGAAGAGLAMTSLSIKDISRLISGPAGFGVGVTVLGVVTGVLMPVALEHWKDTRVEQTIETPLAWNLVLPKSKTHFIFKSPEPPPAKKRPRPRS